MHLHESISHTYADVGRKAIVTCDMSGTGIDPLAFLPPVVQAEIVQQWKAWQAIQPALNAHEADYQPRLERLLRFLLAPSTQLFGSKPSARYLGHRTLCTIATAREADHLCCMYPPVQS